MGKMLSDIFTMNFDIIIPISFCLIAIALSAVLFCIRYFSYRKMKRKYEKIERQKAAAAAADSADRAPNTMFPSGTAG